MTNKHSGVLGGTPSHGTARHAMARHGTAWRRHGMTWPLHSNAGCPLSSCAPMSHLPTHALPSPCCRFAPQVALSCRCAAVQPGCACSHEHSPVTPLTHAMPHRFAPQVAQRVDVVLCDLASALLPAAEGQVDLLVSYFYYCFKFYSAWLPAAAGQVDLLGRGPFYWSSCFDWTGLSGVSLPSAHGSCKSRSALTGYPLVQHVMPETPRAACHAYDIPVPALPAGLQPALRTHS